MSRRYLSFVAWIPAAASTLLAVALTGGCAPPAAPVAKAPVNAQEASDEALVSQIDRALDLAYHHRRLNLRDNAAWQIVHGTLAFKRDFQIEDQQGKLIPVIDYLLAGGRMNGWHLQPGDVLDPATGRRGVRAIVEQGSKTGQGHADQWLGYLSDCGLKPDDTIMVNEQPFTIQDYIHQIEWDVPRNLEREYSWTLMALTAYHPTEYSWTASDGERWDIAKLVQIEAEHDLATSACGGTHRLTGLTIALNRHLAQGGKLEGAWKLADERIQKSIQLAKEYQNPDGSLSANYFNRPGRSPDLATALGTTGHTLEFLSLATTDAQFREPWLRRAATRLSELFEQTKDVPIECGALYHGAHSLVIYRKRAFGSAWQPHGPGSQTAGRANTESAEKRERDPGTSQPPSETTGSEIPQSA